MTDDLQRDANNDSFQRELEIVHSPLTRRELLIAWAWWSLYYLITLLNGAYAFGSTGTWLRTFVSVLAMALIESSALTALMPLIFRWIERGEAGQWSRTRQIASLAVLGLSLTFVMGSLDSVLRLWLRQFPARAEPKMTLGIGFSFLGGLFVYGATLTAGFGRVYATRSRARQQRAARLEAQLASAQLDALRKQLDPHFLFNTLNLISSLADRDPAGVRRMIARLSELLRFSLDADAAEVPLRQELWLLERYADIMRVRFRGRLEIITRADDALFDCMVPSFILQPLVENAVKHGVDKQRGRGCVEIEAHGDGESLVLSVRDNGPGIQKQPTGLHFGVGLRNITARLQQLYGSAGRFRLDRAADGGTIAEIRLPRSSPTVLHTRGVEIPIEQSNA